MTESMNTPTYVLELYHPEDPQQVAKRVFIDPQSYLPVRWEDYDLKHPSSSVWTKVRTNIGLNDNLFTL